MISGIDLHIYLVKDLERAIAFWRDVMGLTLSQRLGEQGAEFELPDGSWFGLWKFAEGEGAWMPGNGIMFSVPDLKAAIAQYRGKGVQIMEHIRESAVCFMAFAQDSEGNGFILHQRKG